MKFTVEIPDKELENAPPQRNVAAWIAHILDSYFGDGFHETVKVDGFSGSDFK